MTYFNEEEYRYDVLLEEGEEFVSEAIDFVAYNREDTTMAIKFGSGQSWYVYKEVPESTFNMFIGADSLGHFYRSYISGKFTADRHDSLCLLSTDEEVYDDMNVDPSAELQEAPLADWERELLGLGAAESDDEAEDFGRKRNLVAGLAEVSDTPVSRPSRARGAIRFGVKYQIAGTGIIAESEIEADDHRDVLITFYARFASELPGHTPVVLSLTQYF